MAAPLTKRGRYEIVCELGPEKLFEGRNILSIETILPMFNLHVASIPLLFKEGSGVVGRFIILPLTTPTP
jgi:hypothetical protein